MMNRVFNNLSIRTVDEDQRIVEGWASTNARDRQDDVLDPLGAEWDLDQRSIPFLLDHDHTAVCGEIEALEATAKGIRFRARLKKINEPGLAKDFVDKCWSILRAGLRKYVSVGFLPLEMEPLPGGNWRFKRWEFLELSACAVPANGECQIDLLKSATGRHVGHRVVKLTATEQARGKFLADADRRADARKRLGISSPPVKLTARDVVNAKLAADRAERKPAKRRAGGVVRLR